MVPKRMILSGRNWRTIRATISRICFWVEVTRVFALWRVEAIVRFLVVMPYLLYTWVQDTAHILNLQATRNTPTKPSLRIPCLSSKKMVGGAHPTN